MADASRRRTGSCVDSDEGRAHSRRRPSRRAVPKTLVVSEARPKPWTLPLTLGDETTRTGTDLRLYSIMWKLVFLLEKGQAQHHQGRLSVLRGLHPSRSRTLNRL